jgi:hypothetical protein
MVVAIDVEGARGAGACHITRAEKLCATSIGTNSDYDCLAAVRVVGELEGDIVSAGKARGRAKKEDSDQGEEGREDEALAHETESPLGQL